ncbi:carbonic anhydrase [Kineococcus glutinatus]|uniref:carbonic anhydrase n=1 Tax=Kineococcus glutinatus TaxID=1070872 RepID=A0ABP9H8X2_9ACTN
MAALDAAAALEELQRGNARFAAGAVEHPAQGVDRRAQLAGGQQPFAAVLSCADSRVPPELVFDRGLGELFVVRTAGQVLSPPVLGSLQYGVAHLGVPLLVVLGHSACGAVQATCDAVAAGAGPSGTAIDSLVDAIRPAAERAAAAGLDAAVRANVEDVVADLGGDELLAAAAAAGRLRIVGAVYDLATGEVTFR